MANNTYVALDARTLSSNTTGVTFNSINQGYTDLVLVCTYASQINDYNFILRFNGDSGNNYSRTMLIGSSAGATSVKTSSASSLFFTPQVGAGTSLNTPGLFIAQIQNYSNTTTYKTVLVRDSAVKNDGASAVYATAGSWRPANLATGNITSLTVETNSGYFVSGSTFTLYGIAADTAITSTAKATGGTITYGVEHTYHVFTAGGTFTPSEALTADVLVVAGGGAGGGDQGGGGGAGGVCFQTGRSLASGTGYTITVGSGGTAVGTTTGNSGINSTFDTITALGGGGGGKGVVGVNGGSGGGGGYNGLAGGSATQGNSGGATGYGNAGSAHDATWNLSGAGGGAGGAGNPPSSSTTSGSGGSGLNTWQDWLYATGKGVSGYIAGGGGGGNYAPQTRFAGAGGAGGGGAGADTTPSTGTAGTVNTGSGGGGGAGATNAAGAGGSGIVIIRYANQGEIDASELCITRKNNTSGYHRIRCF